MKSILILLFMMCFSILSFAEQSLSDVKKEMIKQSINSYSGNCPCPYNTTKRGRSCGKRSAYSRPGGASPLCYESDISDEEARRYLKRK